MKSSHARDDALPAREGLPPNAHKTHFDTDLSEFPERHWQNNPSEYFNYGLNENKWKVWPWGATVYV